MLFTLILSFTDFIDGLNILWHNEIPVTESFADHFGANPAEQSFSCRRPPQNSKLMIPLDDSQRSVLYVKCETVSFHCRRFSTLAIGYVTNNCNATDNRAVFIVSGRVVTVEETGSAGLWNIVGTSLSDNCLSGNCIEVVFVFTRFLQTVEEFKRRSAQHLLALDAGKLFHRSIPEGIPAIHIEGDNAVDVGFQ